MRYVLTSFLFCILLFCSNSSFGQSEVSNWYIGDSAAVTFNSGAPVALMDCGMYTQEGCSSISDSDGNLLFYTNGIEIWNRDHDVMINGGGLTGDISSAQAVLIAKMPASDSLYYVFSNFPSLDYSIVDMSLDGGKGDVISSTKNTVLFSGTTERITGVLHENGCDIWIVCHERSSADYLSFLITASGIDTPVRSTIGSTYSVFGGQSCLKISSDGRKIASGGQSTFMGIELSDFDRQTGLISNLIVIDTSDSHYGVAFSPNNSKLYATSISSQSMAQYDLLAGDAADITNSKVVVDTSLTIGSSAREYTLQLGPDGRIYVARAFEEYLGVINNPNLPGVACDYVEEGVYLGGKICMLGLPNVIVSYYDNRELTVKSDTVCVGDSSYFLSTPPYAVTAWLWDFDDQSSGNNSSTASNPNHYYASSGIYNVSVVAQGDCRIDTAFIQVVVESNELVGDIGNDTTVCFTSSVSITGATGGEDWVWSTGETTEMVNVSDSGLYSVTVSEGFCVSKDSILIEYYDELVGFLGPDTLSCAQGGLTLSSSISGSTYTWSNAQSTSSISVTQSDTVWLDLSDANDCVYRDSVIVDVGLWANMSFANDTIGCFSDTMSIDAGNLGYNYIWSTNETTQVIELDSTSQLFITVTDNVGCPISDSMNVHFVEYPVKSLASDTSACTNDILVLSANANASSYLWSSGDTSQEIEIESAGTHWVRLSNNHCHTFDSIEVTINALPDSVLVGQLEVCDNTKLAIAGDEFNLYDWSTGEEAPSIEVSSVGLYDVTITNSEGCTRVNSISVTSCDFTFSIPNTITPNGDGINDSWEIQGIFQYELNSVRLYNRAGNQVYESTDYQDDFDGTWNGKPLPAATYYYLLDKGNGDEVIKGTLTIIR